MNIYFISGLGADRRAFDKIKLPTNCNPHFIDWIEPHKNEKIESYAKRMAVSIDTESPFVLVGLSFGGIMAIEISKLVKAKLVFLISSISNQHELPSSYRVLGKLNIHKSALVHLLKYQTKVLHWFFGTTSVRLKAYLDEMIANTSINYLSWSLDQILKWKQDKKPANVFHIHGANDKIFPITNVKPDCKVERAGHFMVVTHAKVVSSFMNETLSKNSYE